MACFFNELIKLYYQLSFLHLKVQIVQNIIVNFRIRFSVAADCNLKYAAIIHSLMMLIIFIEKQKAAVFFCPPLGGKNFYYATAWRPKMCGPLEREPHAAVDIGDWGNGALTPVIYADINLKINAISIFDHLLGFNCS